MLYLALKSYLIYLFVNKGLPVLVLLVSLSPDVENYMQDMLVNYYYYYYYYYYWAIHIHAAVFQEAGHSGLVS